MKNNKLTKILAVLFAAVLMFALCSVSVFAETETEAVSDTAVTGEPEAEDEESTGGAIDINFGRAVEKLAWMAEGMICIIAVIGILILVTMLLNKVTAPRKN